MPRQLRAWTELLLTPHRARVFIVALSHWPASVVHARRHEATRAPAARSSLGARPQHTSARALNRCSSKLSTTSSPSMAGISTSIPKGYPARRLRNRQSPAIPRSPRDRPRLRRRSGPWGEGWSLGSWAHETTFPLVRGSMRPRRFVRRALARSVMGRIHQRCAASISTFALKIRYRCTARERKAASRLTLLAPFEGSIRGSCQNDRTAARPQIPDIAELIDLHQLRN